MEDRKRPADQHEGGPPLKRHASTANGGKALDRDADMPWKDDLERFQKDAIYRQMQEYKRERNSLEARVSDMTKRATYHDDHLRVIDAWWTQLLDEVRLLAGETHQLGQDGLTAGVPSTLLSCANEAFQEHLESRSQDIKAALSSLFEKLPGSKSPEVAALQSRVSTLLATEKSHTTELQGLRLEQGQLVGRLEDASLRYMMAEKKLDRAKSAAVAKLERQAILGGGNDTSNAGKEPTANGAVAKANGGIDHAKLNSEIEAARNAAVAVIDKQREQLEKLETDNDGLTSQVTNLTVKLNSLGDDDFARSDLFKHLKSQYEDVIKRINGLEATNLQLRQEAEKLQAERSAYKTQVETEVQGTVGELQSELERVQNDLTRIRAGRDELLAASQVSKAARKEEATAHNHIKDLAAAREDRIRALESELERLRVRVDEASAAAESNPGLDELDVEELRKRYRKLEQECATLNNEIPSLQGAYTKSQALATRKVMDFAALEERVTRLLAEKTKAEQKYFSTMQLNESRQGEFRALRSQNAQSAEVIAQLKNAEKTTRALVVNLEKQLAETKEALTSLTTQNNHLQQQINRGNITAEGAKAQLGEIVVTMKKKDTALTVALKGQRQAEREVETLKSQLAVSKKAVSELEAAAAGNRSQEFEALHTLAYCNICRSRLVNTAIKLCGHTFCKDCIDVRLKNRERKCPTCSKMFSVNDVIAVHL